MRKLVAFTLLLSLIILAGAAYAEEIKMIGTITKIEMASDKKSAIVILKDVDDV